MIEINNQLSVVYLITNVLKIVTLIISGFYINNSSI